MSKRSPQVEQNALAELLRELRVEAGLRQVDLAERLGQPQPFVSRYESGERRIDVLELRALCSVFGITPTTFFARLDAKIDASE